MNRKLVTSMVCSLVLYAGPSLSVPIKIYESDIDNLSNYLADDDFQRYFNPATTTIINFEGPWSPPDNVNSYFDRGRVGNTYRRLGVLFEDDDTFMGGQPGFAYVTPRTVVGAAPNNPVGGQIVVSLFLPGTNTKAAVSVIGAFLLDGPKNDSIASFYDIDDNLLGTVLADDPTGRRVFLGWSDSDKGIHKVIFTNSDSDDYYMDNLTFGPFLPRGGGADQPPSQIPEPGVLGLLGIGLLAYLGMTCRKSL
ncbi:MAG: PEP-CTERM sorting domain-containing protein [Thiobacillaceae bacterium]|nr:PEP-CTERM sorting domain-containing protein [Thiobacillaceae bacterium]